VKIDKRRKETEKDRTKNREKREKRGRRVRVNTKVGKVR
jgi:hypothetical protein